MGRASVTPVICRRRVPRGVVGRACRARSAGAALAFLLLSTAPARPAEPPEKPFDDVVKGAERLEGLFTIHLRNRDLFLEIRPEQLDTPFLLAISLARGLGERWVYYGDQGKFAQIALRRVGDTIHLVQPNTNILAGAGSPEDARSLARVELRGLLARVRAVPRATGRADPYTRAHLEDAAARITRALRAPAAPAPPASAPPAPQ